MLHRSDPSVPDYLELLGHEKRTLEIAIIAAAMELPKPSDQRAQDQERHEIKCCKVFAEHAKKDDKKSVVTALGTLEARQDERHRRNSEEDFEAFVQVESYQRILQNAITALQVMPSCCATNRPIRRYQHGKTAANLGPSRVSKEFQRQLAIRGRTRMAALARCPCPVKPPGSGREKENGVRKLRPRKSSPKPRNK